VTKKVVGVFVRFVRRFIRTGSVDAPFFESRIIERFVAFDIHL
jgi:hypothetical protein